MSESDSSKFLLDREDELQEQIEETENPAQVVGESPDSGLDIALGIAAETRETTPGNVDPGEVKVGGGLVKLVAEDMNVATTSSRNTVAEDGVDGFKTPTSSDHRIPAITQCPPPPKKERPQSVAFKRKVSPSSARRSLQFEEASDEVESIFRPVGTDQDSVEEPKVKKARMDHDDEE